MVFALFVGNLPPEVTELMLAEKFGPAGQILSIYVCRNKKDGFSRCAYVNFCHRAEAERALEMFNFELLLGMPMRVMWSTWKATAKNTKMGKSILKNLDKSINSMALCDTFSVFEKVVEPKSNGHIHYEAVALTTQKLSGNLLKVTIGDTKSHREREAEAHPSHQHQTNKIYIKNLDYSVDDKCLHTVFEQFGTITSAKVMKRNGRSRGVGFVCFSTSSEAKYAQNVMNGRLWGRTWVDVSVAEGKKEDQASLSTQNFQKMLSKANTPAVGTSSAVVSVPVCGTASASEQCPSLWDSYCQETVFQVLGQLLPMDSDPVFEAASASGQCPSHWDSSLSEEFSSPRGSFCSGQCSILWDGSCTGQCPSLWDGSFSGQFPSLWGSFCSGQCPSLWEGSLSGQHFSH